MTIVTLNDSMKHHWERGNVFESNEERHLSEAMRCKPQATTQQ